MRKCNCCGKIMTRGFTDECDFYCCDNCFDDYMNEVFGQDKWKSTEYDEDENDYEDDGFGGYYLYNYAGTWFGTGIYWTKWDENDVDEDILEELNAE